MGPKTRQDDLSLVKAACSGEGDAFDALVLRYQDRIFGVIHRMVGDREKAMDLTQETFLKAWRGLSSFGGNSAFFTWLYRIARNSVFSAGRYDSARPKINRSLDGSADTDDGSALAIEPEDGRILPPEHALKTEREALVLAAIAELPADFREIIVLRDMDDQSYEDIADLLELPLGTVRSRLHRARLELKERLKKVLDPAG